ncbi:MAG: Eco57I restriction-modification methylase domain-containing protein [Spirochaetales bacterium]|nr:Eco57I restriction-modification methylase domain-containing protein [Spirochaetales bacterium]
MPDIKCKSMSMQKRKEIISRLVEQFREGEKFYMSKDFVESECRSKFIDPLLECLGWDVKNEKGARHDKQEVITEDRVVINGTVKHPDYTLCYGGERKIYIEAKQPSIDLKNDPSPALQVRRYAYTSKMPIAILTDFQELAIYDTRIKPKKTDNSAAARIEYITYQQFPDKFEELYKKISWEAVDLGHFDTFYESAKDKKGTATVDDDILAMIEQWRAYLAEDIALHNEDIDEYNLTSAVQRIIDRILFLRICEDKEIEEYNSLKKIADGKIDIYLQLKKLFCAANDKFNAGLFASDKWLDSLNISDKTLCLIINALYYPECQYEFSVLPVEILGSIYEQFLGKIIRFSRKTKNGHSVEIIEKPEVQKAGGVYYTPPYIVKYIVRQTIGKKIEGKTPDEVSKMRFLDPACGSGSFLVGAYQYLLDWHLDYYLSKDILYYEKKGIIYKDSVTHDYKLSVEEKRRILINNIYGVDIDAQAVEVTKLSLFLKLLENEGKALSHGQTLLFRQSDLSEKILPSMSGNIKCGNSLIGSDYYDDKDILLFDMSKQRKINAFDWGTEFADVFKTTLTKTSQNYASSDKTSTPNPFSKVEKGNCVFSSMDSAASTDFMTNNDGNLPSPHRRGAGGEVSSQASLGGFDCVIGNPPYLRVQGLRENYEEESKFYEKKYKSATGRFDFYILFMERGFSLLNKDGILSFILPHKFINADFGTGIRKFIYDNNALRYLVHFGAEQVFERASVYTCIVGLSHGNKEFDFAQVKPKEIENVINFEKIDEKSLSTIDKWNITKSDDNVILDKLNTMPFTVKDIFKGIFQGIVSGDNKAFYLTDCIESDKMIEGFSAATESRIKIEKEICKPIFTGKTISRYELIHKNEYIIFPYHLIENKTVFYTEKEMKENFPNCYEYFLSIKKRLESRGSASMKYPIWYALWNARNILNLTSKKILTPDICYGSSMVFDDIGYFHNDTSYGLVLNNPDDRLYKAYLAILNSSVTWYFLQKTGTSLRGGYFRFKTKYLEPFPLPKLDDETAQKLASLAEQMMLAKTQLANAMSDSDKRMLEQKIDLIDRQINNSVYKLYGLTDDEIRVVEGK